MPAALRPILLTGFEPFGGDRLNPSAEVVRQLDGTLLAGRRVVGVVLPCVFRTSGPRLRAALRRHDPGLVVCLGLAAGRAAITPERVAINVDDARIADNAGERPIDRPIVRGGPTAYWSTLPIKTIVQRLRARGVPAEVSQSAGTFVCNHVFYLLMHGLARRGESRRGGFIHVPCLPGQARRGQPALAFAQLLAGVVIAVETAATVARDKPLAGGAEH